jgi:integrase
MPRTVLPVIRLHDLRHSHTTLLLAAGVPVTVVITLTVYARTMPGLQRDAVGVAEEVFGG